MLRLCLLVLFLGNAAAAQDTYPRLHDVTGVASDDVLNVRAFPTSSASIIGALEPDARGVEVIREENGWGLVNVTEWAGWAYLRYLRPRADGDLPNTQRVSCSGTEPFWGIEIEQGRSATITTPENYDPGKTFDVGQFQRAWNPLRKHVLRGTDGTRDLSLLVVAAYCDNGMSDNEYGLDATLIVTGPDGHVYSGCCSLED